MEDVIAVEVRLDGGARRFFVTYGEWREQLPEAMERAEEIYHCGQPVRRGAR
jgi:hypothetical protein